MNDAGDQNGPLSVCLSPSASYSSISTATRRISGWYSAGQPNASPCHASPVAWSFWANEWTSVRSGIKTGTLSYDDQIILPPFQSPIKPRLTNQVIVLHMQPFTTLTSTAVPLRAENVDTDQIIPARYLTAVTKAGMGDGLFAAWRYQADGSSKPDFVLNQPQHHGAEILLAGRNFGSGSSREHAVWALTEYGFRAVISPGFADIFHNNALKNGLLPITLPEDIVNMLIDLAEEQPDTRLHIDLAAQTVSLPDGQQATFAIDPYRKLCLLQGLDDLGYLLGQDKAITAYEQAHAGVPAV